jgi:tyrosinase
MNASTEAPPLPRTALRHRRNLERLTGNQTGHVRDAIGAAAAVSDDRGLQRWAGIHGLPLPMYCQHGGAGPQGARLFLPWHRAYLYLFELQLRDLLGAQAPAFALPWWDWTSAHSHGAGVPDAFRDRRASGQANPLFSQPVQRSARVDGKPTKTVRDPGDPRELPTRTDVERVLAETDFFTFSLKLEDIHNGVHGWVGGTMGQIPWAAYDPVFWAHHAMIDRIWRLWQLRHGAAGPPQSMWDVALPPFPMTVRQTINTDRLGYDYASSSARTGGPS